MVEYRVGYNIGPSPGRLFGAGHLYLSDPPIEPQLQKVGSLNSHFSGPKTIHIDFGNSFFCNCRVWALVLRYREDPPPPDSIPDSALLD